MWEKAWIIKWIEMQCKRPKIFLRSWCTATILGIELPGQQRRVVKKKLIFYGGEGSATSALTVRKCENFDPFSIEIWFCDTQNTFISLWRVSNANDLLEEPASCKWSSGGACLLQMIIQKIALFRFRAHMRQCQIRVRFESRVKTKFLEPLNQILKLKF